MEERLALALRRMDAQHLTAQDVVNMVIQGDPYGILEHLLPIKPPFNAWQWVF